MNSFEKKYQSILNNCLKNGIERNDRTGVGSYSLFNQSIKVNVSKKFPIITGRKMFPNTFNTEFDWFINGETNIQRFKDNNIKIWDAWANEAGDLGPVYGHQLRNFNSEYYDQLKMLINSLKTNPDSRRHIISLWNPLQLEEMALPPCYLYFQFYVDKNKKLNMFVVQRSGDLFLGIPYDICLFAKTLLYIASETNLKANKLELQIIDAHIYKNQIDSIKEYLLQPIFNLPKYTYINNNLEIINYQSGKKITAAVAV
jgi:thymidylate synthase